MQIITEAVWTPFCAHELLVRSALVKTVNVTLPSSLLAKFYVLINMWNTHYNVALGQIPDTRCTVLYEVASFWFYQQILIIITYLKEPALSFKAEFFHL
jgi:hypothetical protein